MNGEYCANGCKKMNNTFQDVHKCLIQKNEQYRQVLQEIREELKEDTTCESRECGCDDYGECLNCLKETILAKINEVIGAEE